MIKKIKAIFQCYKEDIILLFLLAFLCLDRFGSTPFYLCLLLPFILKKYPRRIDNTATIILLFSLAYSLMALFNGYFDKSFGSFFFFCLFPLFFYGVGNYIGRKSKDSIIYILVFIAVIFAIFPIMMVFKDVEQNQFVNISRDIYDENGERIGNATIIGTKVSLIISFIGLFFAKREQKGEMLFRIILIAISFLGVFVTLHLVNRTGLFVFGVTLFASFLLNRKSLKHYYLYVLIAVVGLAIYMNLGYLKFMFSESTIAYQQREDMGSSVYRGGGRFAVWGETASIVLQKPFGVESGFGIREGFDYAHNIFLDIPLEAGLLPLFLFVAIIVIHFKNLYALYKSGPPDLLFTLIFVMNIAFIMQLISEPVMEGLMAYYFTFYLMIGLCSTLSKRKKLI